MVRRVYEPDDVLGGGATIVLVHRARASIESLVRYHRSMLAHVVLRTPDGQEHLLAHGDIIGRLSTAALRLFDGRVSEAHAMVSLRGGELKLLALRGRFAIGAKPISELTLGPGQRIFMTRDLALDVISVTLPERVIALTGDDLPQVVLSGVCSLVMDPRPAVVPGLRSGAMAQLWNTEDIWHLQLPGEASRELEAGDQFDSHGNSFRAISVAIDTASPACTRLDGRVHRNLTIVAHFDSVDIERKAEPTFHFGGKPARIVSELVSFGGPVDWHVLADEVWGAGRPRHQQRRILDVTLLRLRKKLSAAGIRPDLVNADGSGHLALSLKDGDRVVDKG